MPKLPVSKATTGKKTALIKHLASSLWCSGGFICEVSLQIAASSQTPTHYSSFIFHCLSPLSSLTQSWGRLCKLPPRFLLQGIWTLLVQHVVGERERKEGLVLIYWTIGETPFHTEIIAQRNRRGLRQSGLCIIEGFRSVGGGHTSRRHTCHKQSPAIVQSPVLEDR